MANKILIKRSATALAVPAIVDLDLGELGLNTSDGKLFMKKDDGTESIIEIGGAGYFQTDDTTITSLNKNDYQENFVIGSPQLDHDGNTSHYKKMFFDKVNSSFRAGYCSGTQWDSANIGSASVSIGLNSISSGYSSITFGQSNSATGIGSAAIGYESTTSADYSIAMGFNSEVSTEKSYAFGSNVTVSGIQSIGLGFLQTVSGNYSGAVGYNNQVSGRSSFAAGGNNEISSDYSSALGYANDIIGGNNKYALGCYTTNINSFTIAIKASNDSDENNYIANFIGTTTDTSVKLKVGGTGSENYYLQNGELATVEYIVNFLNKTTDNEVSVLKGELVMYKDVGGTLHIKQDTQNIIYEDNNMPNYVTFGIISNSLNVTAPKHIDNDQINVDMKMFITQNK